MLYLHAKKGVNLVLYDTDEKKNILIQTSLLTRNKVLCGKVVNVVRRGSYFDCIGFSYRDLPSVDNICQSAMVIGMYENVITGGVVYKYIHDGKLKVENTDVAILTFKKFGITNGYFSVKGDIVVKGVKLEKIESKVEKPSLEEYNSLFKLYNKGLLSSKPHIVESPLGSSGTGKVLTNYQTGYFESFVTSHKIVSTLFSRCGTDVFVNPVYSEYLVNGSMMTPKNIVGYLARTTDFSVFIIKEDKYLLSKLCKKSKTPYTNLQTIKELCLETNRGEEIFRAKDYCSKDEYKRFVSKSKLGETFTLKLNNGVYTDEKGEISLRIRDLVKLNNGYLRIINSKVN